MRARYTILSLVTLVLTSCVSTPRQKAIEEELDVPERWQGEERSQVRVDSSWWNVFNDAQLDEILGQALSRNYNLRGAAARMQSAAAQAKIAGAPIYPQASLGLDGSRRKQNFIGLPIPGQDQGVLSTTTNSYGLSLNVSWELDLWGRLHADKAAAVAELQASHADLIGAQLSLAAQVCKIWFAAIEAKRQVELSEATVANWQLSTDQVRSRYEAGVTGSLDLRLTLSNLAVARAALNANRSRYESTLRQLQILLGSYPNANLAIADDLPNISGEVPAGLPADIISRRPDLAAAERRLAASNARVASAKAQLYPRISLTGTGGTASDQLGDLLSGDFTVWSLVGNLMQPIFQGGRLRAGIQLAESSSELFMAEYANAALNAFAEVENSLANERFLDEQVLALSEATEQSLAARDLAENQYSRGLVNIITMLQAQRTAYDSERQLQVARRQRLEARVDLYVSLGGGFAIDQTK